MFGEDVSTTNEVELREYLEHLTRYPQANEMPEIATTSNRGLSFGALLTKIFTHFRVDLWNEDTQNLAPPITDYFIGRADIFTEHPQPLPQPQP